MKKSFEEFLQENMTAKDWLNLANVLQVGLTKATRFLNNPSGEATVDIVRKLSELLNVHPGFLYSEYRVGGNLTMDDFMMLNTWYETTIEKSN